MPTGKPTPIPFPISTFPGKSPQESAGRLINVYAEKLGQDGTSDYTRRRSAGLSLHASTANVGYRGGLVVGNLSYDCWENNASTVNSAGAASSIGNFPGTQNVSMARNQAVPAADVVAVDIDNGAYVLGSATLTAATCTATIGGTSFNKGDSIDLIFLNPYISDLPVTINYVLGVGETASTVAAALNTRIGANTVLVNNNISSTAFGAVLTIKHEGSLGNSTSLTYSVRGRTISCFDQPRGHIFRCRRDVRHNRRERSSRLADRGCRVGNQRQSGGGERWREWRLQARPVSGVQWRLGYRRDLLFRKLRGVVWRHDHLQQGDQRLSYGDVRALCAGCGHVAGARYRGERSRYRDFLDAFRDVRPSVVHK